jgi:hypothetical protein
MYKKTTPTTSAGAAAALTGNKKRKLEYSKAEWDTLLSTIPVSKRSLDALVMDYLIIEGYQSTAQKFAHEANLLMPSSNNSEGDFYRSSSSSSNSNGIGVTSNTSRTSLAPNALLGPESGLGHDLKQSNRMEIKSLILSGQIQAAIELINDVDPELLDTHAQLHFDLLRLQLVELIRVIPAAAEGSSGAELTSEVVTPVLDFAVTHLAKRAAAVPQFLAELEQTMALLCMDPITAAKASSSSGSSTSKARSSLLDLSLRTTVAQDVNTALLAAQGLPNESKITDLVKLWGWTEQELGNNRITVDNDLFS